MKKINLLLLLVIFTGSEVLAAETLTVYSGRNEKFVKPVMKAFTKKTGIRVVIHNAKASGLINRMRLEGTKTRADLFLSNDAGSLQIGTGMGLFQPISTDLGKIEKNYKAADNTWVGLSARARVLVINTAYVNDLQFVKSVFDLADSRLLGKLAITHSANGSFVAGITVYQKAVGDKKVIGFLKGLKTNSAGKVYNKHSKIVKAVASGKKMIGLVNHYYIYRHLKKHPRAPIRIMIPDQGKKGMGVAWNVTGIAVTKHTKKAKLANRLVKFLVSKEGQALFANQNNEYPVRSDVEANKAIPARTSYRIADVPMAELGKSRTATLNLIEKIGLY